MYISEIAPLNLRGGLGTINQLAVTVGMLLSQVLGIKQILGTNDGWPFLLGLAVCPALLQLVLLPICPESPRYLLITKQWEEEARKALRRLRASNQVEEDIEEMRAEERAQQTESSISMTELICSPTLRTPLVIGIVMQLSQQLSGINAVSWNRIEREQNKICRHELVCSSGSWKPRNVTVLVPGLLLFDQSVHQFRIIRRECQIRHDRHRCHHGRHDPGVHTADG